MSLSFGDVAFVIPALNEEALIGGTISSIKNYAPGAKIIVIDNGSVDETRDIARKMGVEVFVAVNVTVGAMRNIGVNKTNSEVVVFLDADVSLTKEWALEMLDVLKFYSRSERIITGSHCSPPPGENWFLKYWFSSFALERDVNHIGTGHMLLSRTAFNDIGGFDESLITGEDYDFCQRAKSRGYKIKNNTDLKVYHYDFPVTVGAFIKREAWHGIGDVGSLSGVFASKVAIAALLFIFLHVLAISAALFSGTSVLVFCVLMIVVLCVLSSIKKNTHADLLTKLCNSILFYFYYCGRAMSFLKRAAFCKRF